MEHTILDELNSSQRDSVVYNQGPSLVIAGAGSGKTRVLTYKIAYLMSCGYYPNTIMALTFTNKAAREMKERIGKMVSQEAVSGLWMGTFHSIFSRILRIEAQYIGYSSQFTVYDSADSKSLLKAIIKERGLDEKIYKPAVVLSRISKAKNDLIDAAQYPSNSDKLEEDKYQRIPLLYQLYHEYVSRCKRADAMDFDDLLFQTNRLFNDHPDILAKYQNRFSFILVDEYQDTNYAQYLIVKRLAEKHHKVCVVGDDAQSIYSFRGADISNILNFQKTYPEAKIFKLEQNYRSTQNIVSAANSVIENNRSQIKKRCFSDKQDGDKVLVLSCYSDLEEGFTVANKIAEIQFRNHDTLDDFAILYRTNAQSRILEEALRKRNLSYRIYGGLSFYQRKEIKDLIAYFRLIANPSDEEALKRIINFPVRGIGETTLQKLSISASQHQVSMWKVLSSPSAFALAINSGTARKLLDFASLITELIDFSTHNSMYDLAQQVVEKTGIKLSLYADKAPEAVDKKENIEEFLSSIYEFCEQKREEGLESSLADFLSEVALLTDMDQSDEDGVHIPKVTMMTIHAAKGLEFKNVMIVGVEENLFPSERSTADMSSLEEERRLFYVAMTRAEQRCVISYAKSRFRHGTTQMSHPSRFIAEMDAQCVQLPMDYKIGRTINSQVKQYTTQNTSSFFDRKQPEPRQSPLGREMFDKKPASAFASDTPREFEFKVKERPKFDFTPEIQRATSVYKKESANPTQSLTDRAFGVVERHLWQIGKSLVHERFGEGTIMAMEGEGIHTKATVSFNQVGQKVLLLKYARVIIE